MPWTCRECQSEQMDERICQDCHTPRFQTWAIMVAHHVLEHLEDGDTDPLRVLELMSARPCYRTTRLTLNFIGQQIRLLTKDTRKAALGVLRGHSAKLALKAVNDADSKDAISILAKWGPETNAERVEHSGSVSIEGRLHEARKRSAAAKEPKP